jgi:hypothetical protein
MSLFENLYKQQLEEMARSTDVADFGSVPEDFPAKAVPNRGTANRFGRHQNSDVQPFFQAVVQDFLSRENKKITYAEVSTAIKNILLKGKDRGGMGMGPTFADKWTQHLSDVLFKLLKSVNAASKAPDSNPAAAEESSDKSPINVAPEAVPQEEPEASEGSTDDEPEPEEDFNKEEQPEAPVENEPEVSEKDLDATAELNLTPEEEALLDVIKNLGGNEVTNKQILADPSTPFKLRDDPSKLREVLGKMAREHGLISRGDSGWSVKERQSSDSESVFDRDEEGEDYGAKDTISHYASQYGDRQEFGSQFESYDVMKAFVNAFKSKSLE